MQKRLIFMFSIVLFSFYLFLSSVAMFIFKSFLPSWVIEKFSDVYRMFPSSNEVDVVMGYILSYFLVTALLVSLSRITKELLDTGDVYNLETHIINSTLAGVISAAISFITKVIGIPLLGVMLLPVVIFIFGGYLALFSFLVFSLIPIVAYLIAGPSIFTSTILYYLYLLVAPPISVYISILLSRKLFHG